jgi:NADH-quinone oxidoreductase subunit E
MLSDRERHLIETEARSFPDRRAAVSEALMIVQESRGWVSDEAVADVAQALGMSADEVDGVATFFELVFRRPVGKHVILACDSVSCWVTGYEGILDHLKHRLGIGLGETTADGLFTLLPAGCLGVCEQAPAMMIGDEVFGNLTPGKVDEILSQLGGGGDADTPHR